VYRCKYSVALLVHDARGVSREVVRAGVFGDRLPPPTMTLEEFADMEMREAQERSAREEEVAQQSRGSGRR